MLRIAWFMLSAISQIVNYLGQVSTEVKGNKRRLVYYNVRPISKDLL